VVTTCLGGYAHDRMSDRAHPVDAVDSSGPCVPVLVLTPCAVEALLCSFQRHIGDGAPGLEPRLSCRRYSSKSALAGRERAGKRDALDARGEALGRQIATVGGCSKSIGRQTCTITATGLPSVAARIAACVVVVVFRVSSRTRRRSARRVPAFGLAVCGTFAGFV